MKLILYSLCLASVIHAGFMLSRVQYECRPYKPTEECQESRYDVRFYSMSWNPRSKKIEKEFVGISQSRCVAKMGSHLYLQEMTLSAHLVGVWHQPEYYEEQQVTSKLTEVCRVE